LRPCAAIHVAATPVVGDEIDAIATAIHHADKGRFWDMLVNESGRLFDRRNAATFIDPAVGIYFYEKAVTSAILVGLALLAIVWFRNRKRLAAALASVHGLSPPLATDKSTTPVPAAPTPSKPIVRTLSVMFSDVKDYTARAAQESRLGILDLVRRHRDLAAPIVKRRGGSIIKSLGDGLLITFESATDAVLAGLEIQAAAAAHNKSAFADRDKLELRIAVSTGEVAQEHGDVFGETVNLASRAQQHAAPGEVLFTDVTWATINRREVPAAEAGTFDLKGICDPVRLYRALPRSDTPAPATDTLPIPQP
jgi:class 3 adenylate cyclase